MSQNCGVSKKSKLKHFKFGNIFTENMVKPPYTEFVS